MVTFARLRMPTLESKVQNLVFNYDMRAAPPPPNYFNLNNYFILTQFYVVFSIEDYFLLHFFFSIMVVCYLKKRNCI